MQRRIRSGAHLRRMVSRLAVSAVMLAPAVLAGQTQKTVESPEPTTKAPATDPLNGKACYAHGAANLSCAGCHQQGKSAGHALKTPQPELCFECHEETKADFSLPFHHDIAAGDMLCTSCHDPHNASSKQAHDNALLHASCAKCHAKEAGPFRYKHKAVEVEGCLACHSPHGSHNIHLLKQSKVDSLCELCHSVSNVGEHGRIMSASGHADSRATRKACCTDCHAEFHGSNSDKNFLK